MTERPLKLSLAQARRIALAAQGLAGPRPDKAAGAAQIGRPQILRTVERLGLLQMDSVNVLTRMHYLPLFSRLGDYPRAALEEAAWGRKSRRALFEYWAHEASLLPLKTQPLLRWRMDRADRGLGAWGQIKPFAGTLRPEALALLKRIEQEGPLAASDLDGPKGVGGWWGWSADKSALEWLFWSGRITTRTRRASFERVYDLTERVLPASILHTPTPGEADAHRALLAIAARAHGIATVKDLRDYFRQSPEDARPRIPELVEAGELIPVQVEGWRQPAYLHRDAKKPRAATGDALLAPFDPLVWERSRTELLFGFRYRIEIYTPADKRQHGYFVLPFLAGDRIAARVDLKSDRGSGRLLVQAAYAEPGAPPDLAERLARELRLMAGCLGLGEVAVQPRGDLAARLRAAL